MAIAVVYDAGARDEERGQSGLSRLDERLMFEGSRNVLAGDHARLIAGRGGVVDAASGPDRATFTEALPAGDLALGLWLEADRMRGLAPTQTGFDALRRTLQEEHRARVSGVAYQAGRVRLEELVYQGYWPYEHAALDLDGAELAWVEAFRASHYGPGSAVLSIAGDVDADAAMAMVHRYFDDVPRGAPAPGAFPALPEQTSQRTAVIEDGHARTPGLFYGWAIPPAQSASSTRRSSSRGRSSPAARAPGSIASSCAIGRSRRRSRPARGSGGGRISSASRWCSPAAPSWPTSSG